MDGRSSARAGRVHHVLITTVGMLLAASLASCTAGRTDAPSEASAATATPNVPEPAAAPASPETSWYVHDAVMPAAAVPSTPSPVSESIVPAAAGTPAPPPRFGDEIVVAGRFIRIGTPVVLWTDSGGYGAPPTHYGTRFARAPGDKPTTGPALMGGRELDATDAARVRAEGWRFDDLTQVVDQFVLHYDVCGVSSECFRILRLRGLSVHFMLDIDGTIYQTCDVQERAYHATTSNDRSVGIEIANIGAYAPPAGARATPGEPYDGPMPDALAKWYRQDDRGVVRITLPAWMGDGRVRTPGFVGSPARPQPVAGLVQGQVLVQYDLTPQQYDALGHLSRALCETFPRLRRDYPREGAPLGGSGPVQTRALTEDELASFSGVLGHWHVQKNKIDPGPALDWERAAGR